MLVIKSMCLRLDSFHELRVKIYRYFFRRKIKVFSVEETLCMIICNRCSIGRFGDGEFYIMNGKDIGFQDYHSNLSKRLLEVFSAEENGFLIGIDRGINPKYYKEYYKQAIHFWQVDNN